MKTFLINNSCGLSWENRFSKCKIKLYSGDYIQLTDRCETYSKKLGCTDSAKLNLTVNDYSLLMGVTANMFGFTLIFLVGFLFVLQGRR